MHMHTSEQCSCICEQQWFAIVLLIFDLSFHIGDIENQIPGAIPSDAALHHFLGRRYCQADGFSFTDQTRRPIPRPQKGPPLFCAQ